MRYVVRVIDPADDSVHVYRFSDETEAHQFASVMQRLGGDVEVAGEDESPGER